MAKKERKKGFANGAAGIPIDAFGGATIDPTQNVLNLVEAAILRQDNLREYAEKLADAKADFTNKIAELRAIHQRELDVAEAQRLDAIRQVDREDVTKTAVQALTAIQALAATTTTTAETLRTQVATTAQAAQNQLATITNEINKRLSALEQTSFEGKGKQQLADPQMLELLAEMRSLRAASSVVAGGQEHKTEQRSTMLFVAAIIGALIGVAGFVSAFMK